MLRDPWKYSIEFMNRFGSKLVSAIKRRTPVDTGSLRADVTYEIKQDSKGLYMLVYIDDHIMPVNATTLPSVYGIYQDQGTKYIAPTYFMTAPVPGLTADDFVRGLENAMVRDYARQLEDELNTLKTTTK